MWLNDQTGTANSKLERTKVQYASLTESIYIQLMRTDTTTL